MSEHIPTAKAASVMLDLLGAEHFADQGVEFIKQELTKVGYQNDLGKNQEMLVKVGASATAQLILDEVRKFAKRESVDDREEKDQETIWHTL